MKGESIGSQMFENHKHGGGWTAPPIKFNLHDSPQVKQLKILANNMIQFDPADRPTIDDVLRELESILGNRKCSGSKIIHLLFMFYLWVPVLTLSKGFLSPK